MTKRFSEYVSPGHPDKCADYISEYILDRYIEKDPNVRYAVEVMIKGNMVHLAGEITSTAFFGYEEMCRFVKDALAEIGYTEGYYEAWSHQVINPSELVVITDITAQSPEIGQGVDNGGWGDQGIFYGYADMDGDESLMPLDHSYAKSLCRVLYLQAKEKGIGGIDIKTEVILDDHNWIEKVIAAVPCRSNYEYELIKKSIKEWYDTVEVDLPFYPQIILNGTGNYVMHGPVADCGITGRKLAVDFYGGNGHIGGGNLWTKDGSKADLALNLLARNLAIKYSQENNCSVSTSLACCIGRSEIEVVIKSDCDDQVILSTTKICSPKELIEKFGLNKPIFTSMCIFGPFGRFQDDKKWEQLD